MPVLLVAVSASCLMFWNLGSRYLWQDEAATAVLAERMIRFGKPLGYDGRNLITMDWYPQDDENPFPSDSAEASIEFFVARGDFRRDTTWTGHPWGQFVLAALSMMALGKSTLATRLPFALCGVVTAILFVVFVQRRFRDTALSTAAILLLLGNVFWVLHMRQCRYYAPSSMLLLLTFVTYLRWRDRGAWGSGLFVLTAWCFFQCDFGTFWPVTFVLLVDAAWSFRGRRFELARAVLLLAVLIGPWIWYLELFSRLKPRLTGFWHSLTVLLFNFNQYQLPLVVAPVFLLLLWRARRDPRTVPGAYHAIRLAAAVIAALMIWVPLVTPFPFYRYFVIATPISCLLLAYTCAGLIDLAFHHQAASDLRVATAIPLAGLLVCTQLAAVPVRMALLAAQQNKKIELTIWRPELQALYVDLLDIGPDPNRELVAELAPRLAAGDAVLINYEDIPLMFYTDAEIRGGISAFRAEDRSARPPKFVVLRLPFSISRMPIQRELSRSTWRELPVAIPSVPFGNIPDPLYHRVGSVGQELPNLLIFEATPPERGGHPVK